MCKQEITVKCLFPDGGEDIRLILFRSFRLFLRRELENTGRDLASPSLSGV